MLFERLALFVIAAFRSLALAAEQVTDGKYASAGIARLCLHITCLPSRCVRTRTRTSGVALECAWQTQGALRRLCLKLSTPEDENCPPRKGKESASCSRGASAMLLAPEHSGRPPPAFGSSTLGRASQPRFRQNVPFRGVGRK